MVNKCYQKHKRRLLKEARERYQNLFEKKMTDGVKKSKTDTKSFLKNKSRKYLSI